MRWVTHRSRITGVVFVTPRGMGQNKIQSGVRDDAHASSLASKPIIFAGLGQSFDLQSIDFEMIKSSQGECMRRGVHMNCDENAKKYLFCDE